MKFHFVHENFNVRDLAKSMKFYEEALGLREVRRKETDAFTIVYLGDGVTDFELELTWLRARAPRRRFRRRSRASRKDGLHLLRKPDDGHLLHSGPRRILDRDPADAVASSANPKPMQRHTVFL